MPGKVADAGRASGKDAPAYRRADLPALAEAAERLRARGRVEFPSQAAFVAQLRRELLRADPSLRIGPRRLRQLLLATGRLSLSIAYSTRTDRRPLRECPVCAGPLRRLVNQTLDNDRVVLGYACPLCGYWTHLGRRVPVRYGIRLRAGRRVATAPRSG